MLRCRRLYSSSQLRIEGHRFLSFSRSCNHVPPLPFSVAFTTKATSTNTYLTITKILTVHKQPRQRPLIFILTPSRLTFAPPLRPPKRPANLQHTGPLTRSYRRSLLGVLARLWNVRARRETLHCVTIATLRPPYGQRVFQNTVSKRN
jgi:hypothetical protein